MKYGIPQEISVFHNKSNYADHFIIKELAKEFAGELNYLQRNTETCKTFSVLITQEVKRIGKNREDTTKTISYKLQLIDSTRFMASSLSNLVDNLLKEFIKLNANMDLIIKNSKHLELNTKIVSTL